MKKFENLGIALTKNEQKKINGGHCQHAQICVDQWGIDLESCFRGVGSYDACAGRANNDYWNCMNGCNELPY